MDGLEEDLAAQAEIDEAAEERGQDRQRQRDEEEMSDFSRPKTCDAKARHSRDTGRQKVALQRCAEVLWRPTAHRSIDDERWAVHAIGSAHDAGEKSAYQQQGTIVRPQLRQRTAKERVAREEQDHDGQRGFDRERMRAAQKQRPKRDAGKSWQKQPQTAAQMDVAPVLKENDGCDGDGQQHSERRGDVDRDEEREQWDGHKRLAEAEGGPDERSNKYDRQDPGSERH